MVIEYKEATYLGISGKCEDVYKQGKIIGIIISKNNHHYYYQETGITTSAAAPTFSDMDINKVKKWIKDNE